MLVSETVDQIILFLREMCAELRSELGADRDEALESLLERLQIEVLRLLVLSVLSGLHLLLHSFELGHALATFAAASGLLLLATLLVSLGLLVPVQVVASAVDVVDWEAEDLKRVQKELQLSLDVAHKRGVRILGVKEVFAGRIGNLEILEPFVEIFLASVSLLELLVLFLIVHNVLNLLVDLFCVLDQVLLEGHALGNNVALLSLLATRDPILDLIIVFDALDLRLDQLSAVSHSVHELRLEQVVKRVQIEALVQELQVHLLREAHQTDGLVLDLGDECLVGGVLGCDELGDKVLAVGLRDRLRLRVEHICQVIVILLLRQSNFDEG